MNQRNKPLKVLLSAYACEPGKGSEPGVGWNVARELSSRVSLWVITRANNQAAIEGSGEDWIKQVQWIYWDPPKWLTFWKKGGRGVQLFYGIWQFGLKAVVAKALAAHDFDVIHHLTFGKYWIPSRLAGLPRPFIFGPVGGGECSPSSLAACSSRRGRIAEMVKGFVIGLVTMLPGTKSLYHSAAWSFAATTQTELALRQLGVSRVSILPQSGIRPSDLPRINPPSSQWDSDELLLVTAARLIHWKAIHLAIEAIAEASRTIRVRLIVLQTGPEMKNLKALARRLGVGELVEFKGRLPRLEDVYQEIARADALVHPALHEAFGQACLESLALGVPVICLNWGGPGLITDLKTGFAVEPGDQDETVERLTDAIRRLDIERRAGISRSTDCQTRAFGHFGWDHLAEAILSRYHKILDDKPHPDHKSSHLAHL